MPEQKQVRHIFPLIPKQFAKSSSYPLPEGIVRAMDLFFKEHVKKGDFGIVKTELQQNPRYLPIALCTLAKSDPEMFQNAAIIFMDMHDNIINHEAIAEEFNRIYEKARIEEKSDIVSTLKDASEQIGISSFLPLLTSALSLDDVNTRIMALEAIFKSRQNGANITSAIPALISLLADDELVLRIMISDNLLQMNLAKAGKEEKSQMVGALLSVFNSRNFQEMAQVNSVAFVEVLRSIQSFIEKLDAELGFKEAV